MLPTNNSVPIENVVVAESGDDSDGDDGWNYIHGEKEKQSGQERDTPVELIDSENEKDHSKPAIEVDSILTSPTPPTASIGETEFVNQESHAIAQAFAEPEEACSEVFAQHGFLFFIFLLNFFLKKKIRSKKFVCLLIEICPFHPFAARRCK